MAFAFLKCSIPSPPCAAVLATHAEACHANRGKGSNSLAKPKSSSNTFCLSNSIAKTVCILHIVPLPPKWANLIMNIKFCTKCGLLLVFWFYIELLFFLPFSWDSGPTESKSICHLAQWYFGILWQPLEGAESHWDWTCIAIPLWCSSCSTMRLASKVSLHETGWSLQLHPPFEWYIERCAPSGDELSDYFWDGWFPFLNWLSTMISDKLWFGIFQQTLNPYLSARYYYYSNIIY